VAFSPDGQRALTASKDQTAVLWNLTDGPKGPGASRVAPWGLCQQRGILGPRRPDPFFERRTEAPRVECRQWRVAGPLYASQRGFPRQFAPDGNSIFAIGKISGTRTQAEATGADQAAPAPALRAVRPVTWSFAPLQEVSGRRKTRHASGGPASRKSRSKKRTPKIFAKHGAPEIGIQQALRRRTRAKAVPPDGCRRMRGHKAVVRGGMALDQALGIDC
jgi:hypothetical protein